MIIRSFSRQYRLKSNRKKRRAKRAHACKTGNPILSFALVDTIHGFLVSGFTLQKGNRIVPKNVAQRHRWSWSQVSRFAPPSSVECLERVGGGIWRIILRCHVLDPVVIRICGIF